MRDYLVAGPDGTAIDPVPATAAAAAVPAESTQVLTPSPAATASTPPTSPSVTTSTQPPGEARSASAGGPRTSTVLIGAGVVALIVLLFVAWSLWSGDDEPSGAIDPGNVTSTPTDGGDDTETPEPDAEPTAEDMEAFIADYLATASSSPATAFDMLTRSFQRASGGAGGYTGFWNTIESAELLEIGGPRGADRQLHGCLREERRNRNHR